MPKDTYNTSSGGRRDSSALVYDPKTGKWVPSSPASSSASQTHSSPNPGKSPAPSGEPKKSASPPSDSKAAADKEFIEVEFNTLTGDLALTSTEKSIRIKVGDTIRLEGVGKYLSGLYFVSSIKRSLSKDNGYTHTLSLIKNGFGDSLKKSPPTAETRKEEVKKDTAPFKVGDKVRIVGDSATYSNASEGVKVPKWVKQKTLTIDAISKDGTRVRLNPIWSWTYIKNIQKV